MGRVRSRGTALPISANGCAMGVTRPCSTFVSRWSCVVKLVEKRYFQSAESWRHSTAAPVLRLGLIASSVVILTSLLAAKYVPQGRALTAFGDGLQTALIGLAAILAFQNIRRSHGRLRIFWFLFCAGTLAWTVSTLIWSVQEVWFDRAVPDVPVVDILLFLKIVPLSAAAHFPRRAQHPRRSRG